MGGISIASHIDCESFSIIGQLGFIPEGLSLDAVEVSPKCTQSEQAKYKNFGIPLVTSSDAHYLSDIGKSVTIFLLYALSLSEIVMAFQGVEGRKVIL